MHKHINIHPGYKAMTLSLDGEKLTPEVGAECCFNQDT